MSAIDVRHLTKLYGEKRAVDDVSFEVPEGQIVGFLGPNGAGKTTTLRVLLGLARPTSGAVTLLGQDATTAGNAVRSQLGFLPDVPGFPAWMSAPEFLRFVGSLFGIGGDVLDGRVGALLELAGLAGVPQRIGGFSRGMKQRLGIAQALVNAPRLLLLDEPTSALDPLGRKDVLTMIESLRGRATVLFSTHLLDDVERVCDSAVILNRGRVVTCGSITDLRSRYGGATRIRLVADGDLSGLEHDLSASGWAHDLSRDGQVVTLAVDSADVAGRHMPALLAARDCVLREYGLQQVSLEDVFVKLTGEAA